MHPPPEVVALLPDGARPDLATRLYQLLGSGIAQNGIAYRPPGGFYIVLSVVKYVLTTDATVATRTTRVNFLDPQNNVAVSAVQPAAIGASTQENCYYISSVNTAYTSSTFTTAPLPLIYLDPTWEITIQTINAAVGDQLSSVSIMGWRIPSGPPIESETPNPLATPLIA